MWWQRKIQRDIWMSQGCVWAERNCAYYSLEASRHSSVNKCLQTTTDQRTEFTGMCQERETYEKQDKQHREWEDLTRTRPTLNWTQTKKMTSSSATFSDLLLSRNVIRAKKILLQIQVFLFFSCEKFLNSRLELGHRCCAFTRFLTTSLSH